MLSPRPHSEVYDEALEDEEPTTVQVRMPPKMVSLFEGDYRTRGAWGGRGSGKTRGFAKMAAVKGLMFGMSGMQGQILCAREHLNSIEESSMQEVKMAIREEDWLEEYYDVGEKYIRSRDGNIEFVFAGLRRNLASIKSKARILLCWVDEAEQVTDKAWRTLIPTVREEGSEIWVSWNPEIRDSATDIRFRRDATPDMKIIEMNYRDNPWFPAVLEAERLNDKAKRPDTYEHVWEGEYLEYAEGAYYLHEMKELKANGYIGNVPYEKGVPVTTAWDLGVGDSTAIWFHQQVGAEHRLIDYYETGGVGLDHYAKVLQDKGYVYGTHILPHDVKVRELGSGKSRLETLRALGLQNIHVAPALNVDDGIQAARTLLGAMWIDETKCERGIQCLRQYRREYNDVNQVWHNRPLHNWASHGADAFRYLAIGQRKKSGWGDGPLKRNMKGIA